MAIAGEAILDRIHEVLTGGFGTLRTITAGTYGRGVYESLSREEAARRADLKPRVEATIARPAPHPFTVNVKASKRYWTLDIEVHVYRFYPQRSRLNDALRAKINGDAVADVSTIVEALTYPGNLTQTEAGTATGLVSGLLVFDDRGATATLRELSGSKAHLIETVIPFTGTVNVTQAVS